MKFKISLILLFLYSFTLVVFASLPETTNIENAIGGLLIISYFAESIYYKNFRLRWNRVLSLALLFLSYSLISLLLNPDSLRRFITLVLVIVLFYVTYGILRETRNIKLLTIGITAGLLISIILDFNSIRLAISGQSVDRLSGLIGNANTYSMYLLIASLLLLLNLIANKNLKSIYRYIIISLIIAFSLVIITTTGSRKSTLLLGFLALSFFFVFSKNKKLNTKIGYFIVFSLVLVGFIVLFKNSVHFQRFQNLIMFSRGELVGESSLGTREEMIKTAIELWKEKPFFGWGFDSFRDYGGFQRYSHSNYIELLFNQGIFGLLLFYSLYYSIISDTIPMLREHRHHKNIIIAHWSIISLLMLMIWDIAAVSYYSKIRWLFLAVVLATILNLKEELYKQSKKSA